MPLSLTVTRVAFGVFFRLMAANVRQPSLPFQAVATLEYHLVVGWNM